jgi:hypothetical protein
MRTPFLGQAHLIFLRCEDLLSAEPRESMDKTPGLMETTIEFSPMDVNSVMGQTTSSVHSVAATDM